MDDERQNPRWIRIGFNVIIGLAIVVVMVSAYVNRDYFRLERYFPSRGSTTVTEGAKPTPKPAKTTPTKDASGFEDAVMCQAVIYDETVSQYGPVSFTPVADEGTDLSAYLVCRGVPAGTKVSVRVATEGQVYDSEVELKPSPSGLAVQRGLLGVVPKGNYVVEYRINGKLVARAFVQVV